MDKLSDRDRVGISAEVLGAAGGAAAGVAVAGTAAAAAGATTLLGSTSLASVLGGVFVTATPVGWIVASAVLAGAAGYGLTKLIRSGAHQDRVRGELIERLSKRLEALGPQSREKDTLAELAQLISIALAASLITAEQGNRMINLVDTGVLSAQLAVERLRAMALASGDIVQRKPT
jgi:hypothetical protein